ncbi:sphingomyelin phosphodiesterase 3-like [Megalops cyprinoides]|uniref:sphingomyelin phosphodiesterase 3-like n=1 Tax=Megalops cyprinoides TaxID=118141 RepID=UPI001863D59F|nr:sphingomyelin phosphodiesterase 3-like [Megalops cyprinoides]
MVLYTSAFSNDFLHLLNSLSWVFIFPCYWLLDRLLASFVATTKEKRQHSQDPCSSRALCALVSAPLYLALILASLPFALLGFLLWAPLQAARRPYVYSQRRVALQHAEQGSNPGEPPARWRPQGRSFCFCSANVCLLPDSLARFNNLSDTQGRAREVGTRIRNGASRPQIKIFVDSPTNTSVSAASFSSLAQQGAGPCKTQSAERRLDSNGRLEQQEGGRVEQQEGGRVEQQREECAPQTGPHTPPDCPLHSSGHQTLPDCPLHPTGQHTLPDCPLHPTGQPSLPDCPLHTSGYHTLPDCPLHPTGPPTIPDCPLHTSGQITPLDCPLHPAGQHTHPDCPLHASEQQTVHVCPLHPSGQQTFPDCPIHSTGQHTVPDCPLHTSGQHTLLDCPIHPSGQQTLPDCPLHASGQQTVHDCPVHPSGQQNVIDCPLHSPEQHTLPDCPLHATEQHTLPDCPLHATEQHTLPDCPLHPTEEQTLPDCPLHSTGYHALPDCPVHPIGQHTLPDCPVHPSEVQISISASEPVPEATSPVYPPTGDAGSPDSYIGSCESLPRCHAGARSMSNSAPSRCARKPAGHKCHYGEDGFDHEISAFFPANLDFLCLQEVFDRRAAFKLRQQLHHYFPFMLSDVGRYAWKGCCSQFKFLNSGLLLASRYPILDAEYQCYPNGHAEDALAAKGALFVKVQVGTASQDQRIVGYITCTHLHAIEGDAPIRCKQLDLLLEWGAQFRKATSRPAGTKGQKDQIAFDVVLGDLNFDNCSSDDKLEQQHTLFSHYKDPCRLGPGEDQPWALGTLLDTSGLYDEEVTSPEGLQKVMENEEGRKEYLVYPTSKKQCSNQKGRKIPLKGNGRRIDYILYGEEQLQQDWKADVEEYSFITQLAGLTDHLAVAMRLAVSTGEEE